MDGSLRPSVLGRLLRPAGGAVLALLSLGSLLGCSARGAGVPRGGAQSATPRAGAAAGSAPETPAPATADEQDWARRALAILQTVDTAVQEYHDATALPAGSLRRQQLQDSAFRDFHRAVADHEALWPVTQRIGDGGVRDQFVFIMGNVGGFLNPTPDLPADPPTLGDRIGRSLQNVVSTSAAVRPKLERLATGR